MRQLVGTNGYTPLHVAVETYARAARQALEYPEYWEKGENEHMGIAQKGIWEHSEALAQELKKGAFSDEVAYKFLDTITEQRPPEWLANLFEDPGWLTQYDPDLVLVLLNHPDPPIRAIGLRSARFLSRRGETVKGPEDSYPPKGHTR